MNSDKRIWNQTAFNKYKNWAIIILVITIVLLTCLRKRPVEPAIPDNTPILQRVDQIKDENDKLYAQVQQKVLENAIARKFADSLAKALRVKPKFVRGVDQYVYSVDTVFTVTPVVTYQNKDTAFTVRKKDLWVDIEANVRTRGQSTLRFSSKDTLTRTEIVKTPLFGATTRYITIRNANPYNVVEKGYSWTVKEKRAWLTVGPYIGYDVLNMRPSIGVSVQLPLIQLKK